MGLWQRHRERQAGKYMKKNYRLNLAEERAAEAVRRQAAGGRSPLELTVQRLGLEPHVPPRPDLELP